MKEYILCAANWYQNVKIQITHQPFNIKSGVVLCGHRHHNIIEMFCKLTGATVGDNCVQGFLTNTNNFVDRERAFEIAEAANQLNDRNRFYNRTLFSEDLY